MTEPNPLPVPDAAVLASLRGRSLLRELDFTPEQWMALIELAAQLKAAKRAGREDRRLLGKNIALLFEKTSTRTRCSFEVGAHDQGAHVTYLDPTGSQIGHKESIADTARVLGRMFDGLEYRGDSQAKVTTLAELAGIPVWNGLTDDWHPTQMLADQLTMIELSDKPLTEISCAYLGDARNNVANSLLVSGALVGMDIRLVAPKELQPEAEVVAIAEGLAAGRFTTGPTGTASLLVPDHLGHLGRPGSARPARLIGSVESHDRLGHGQRRCIQPGQGVLDAARSPRAGRQRQEGGGRRRGQVRARHQQGGDLAVRQRRQVHGEVLGGGGRAHPHQNTPPPQSRTERGVDGGRRCPHRIQRDRTTPEASNTNRRIMRFSFAGRSAPRAFVSDLDTAPQMSPFLAPCSTSRPASGARVHVPRLALRRGSPRSGPSAALARS